MTRAAGRILLVLSVTIVPAAAAAQPVWVPGQVLEATPVTIVPNAARTPLATLPAGRVVTVIAIENDWLNVAFEDARYGRRVGYVPRKAVRFSVPGMPSASATASAARTTAPPPSVPPAPAKPADATVAAAPLFPSATPAAAPAPVVPPAPAASVANAVAPVASVANAEPVAPKPEPVGGILFPPATDDKPPVRLAPPPRESVVTTTLFPSAVPDAMPPKPAPPRRDSVVTETVFPTIGAAVPSTAPPPVEERAVSESAPAGLPDDAEEEEPAREADAPRALAAAEGNLDPAGAAETEIDEPAPVPVNHADATAARDDDDVEAATPASRNGRMPVSPRKGMLVTLMIPRALLKEDGAPSGKRTRVVTADIDTPEPGAVTVNGVSEWMKAGLPSLVEASVERVNHRKEYTELELRNRDLAVKLRFANDVEDPEGVLGQIVAEGASDTDVALKYRDEAYSALAETFFSSIDSEVPAERISAILGTLQASEGRPDLHLHDGQLYAAYDLGSDVRIFNDSEAAADDIVGHVLDDTLLPRLAELAAALKDVPEVEGIRAAYRIPHKSERYAPVEEYAVELVTAIEPLAAFRRGELTGEELLASTVVTIDGERAAVALPSPAQ